METYNELIEWLVMLNKNPKYKTPENLFKSVQYAFKHVNMINGMIDKSGTSSNKRYLTLRTHLWSKPRDFRPKLMSRGQQLMRSEIEDRLSNNKLSNICIQILLVSTRNLSFSKKREVESINNKQTLR